MNATLEAIKTGAYEKPFTLTIDNYFSKEASQEYMSNSQYKGFLECEAKEFAKMWGYWVDDEAACLLMGKYVHAWNEGKLDEFKELHPQLFKKYGELKAEYKKCNEIIEVIKKDKLFMAALSGKKEVMLTAEMFGTKWKILIDSYFPEYKRFGDLKVVKDIHEKFWNNKLNLYENIFEFRGYYTQMAIYAEIERLSSNRAFYFEPFIAMVTKEKYPDKAIISFVSDQESHEDFIRDQLIYVENNMPRILAVKSGKETPVRCERCDYCRSTKKLKGTTHYSSFNLY